MVAAAVAAAQGLLGYTLRAAEAPEEFPFGLGKSVCGRSLGSLSVPGRHGGDAGRRGLNFLRRGHPGGPGTHGGPRTLAVLAGEALEWSPEPTGGRRSSPGGASGLCPPSSGRSLPPEVWAWMSCSPALPHTSVRCPQPPSRGFGDETLASAGSGGGALSPGHLPRALVPAHFSLGAPRHRREWHFTAPAGPCSGPFGPLAPRRASGCVSVFLS